MTLSTNFLLNITTKLGLQISELKQKQSHTNILVEKTNFLKQSSKLNKSQQFELYYNLFEKDQKLLVCYIVKISFSRSNTTIQFINTKGNLKLSLNAGNVGFKGKLKSQRRTNALHLLQMLIDKTGFREKQPIAVHFKNVKSHKRLIIEKLQQFFFIRVIRSFNCLPYNGCRKPKIRRKKRLKTTKR